LNKACLMFLFFAVAACSCNPSDIPGLDDTDPGGAVSPEQDIKGIVTATTPVCLSRITGNIYSSTNAYVYPRYGVDNQTISKYDVAGTDLGIPWEIAPGKYGLFFGDTFGSTFKPTDGGGGNGSNWRGNVLLFSTDTDLSDGLTITSAAMNASAKYAREICLSSHDTSGNGDYTSIPTSVVHANGCEYVHYFNIKTWSGWTTNHSKVYKSTDGGKNWSMVSSLYFSGNSPFGQIGYFNNTAKDGYVYMMGTQTGRSDNAHVARFKEEDIEDQEKYEYWSGSDWVAGKEKYAAPVISDKVGELSIAWLENLGKWIVLYVNEPRGEITMRYADEITGPWSQSVRLLDAHKMSSGAPALYGSFIHPLSLKEESKLYFVVSSWKPYNTFLMMTELKVK